MFIKFSKYHGTGNDFILIDQYQQVEKDLEESEIKAMCERRFGIGADGLIILRKHLKLDFEMLYYNADGRTSSMCGNGGRCIVHFANALGIIENKCRFLAIDGEHEAEIDSGIIKLQMKDVSNIETIDHGMIMDTGSPHIVIRTQDEINLAEFRSFAQSIRYSERFKESGINVNVYHQLTERDIEGFTYERGVEGITYTCGTGVCAMAIAFAKSEGLLGHVDVKVHGLGGALNVSFDAEDSSFQNVSLIGPAVQLYTGEWN